MKKRPSSASDDARPACSGGLCASTPKPGQRRAGPAKPELVEAARAVSGQGVERTNVTAPLRVESPNSGDVYLRSDSSPEPKHQLTTREVRIGWATISIYDKRPMPRRRRGSPSSTSSSRSTAATAGQRRRRSLQRRARHAGCRISERCVDPLHGATRAAVMTIRVRDENGKAGVASC